MKSTPLVLVRSDERMACLRVTKSHIFWIVFKFCACYLCSFHAWWVYNNVKYALSLKGNLVLSEEDTALLLGMKIYISKTFISGRILTFVWCRYLSNGQRGTDSV